MRRQDRSERDAAKGVRDDATSGRRKLQVGVLRRSVSSVRAWRWPARMRPSLEGPLLLIIVIVVLVIVLGILLRHTAFLSGSNLLSIVQEATPVSIMAVATVFVMTAGEIDLSFASVPPVAGLVAALLMERGWPLIVAVLAALLLGLAVGFVNGSITVGLKIPSFIVTLGMIGVLEGLALLIGGQVSIPISNSVYLELFGSNNVGPIPILVLWTLGGGIIGTIILRSMSWGKAVLATGGNRSAAMHSGIRTAWVRTAVLIISGGTGGLAGLLYSGQLASARYDLSGSSALLNTLAAAIIGGTSLAGGRGSVAGAIAGSLLLGLVDNGVILLGFSTSAQEIVTGVIIVAAVGLSSDELRRLASRLRRERVL